LIGNLLPSHPDLLLDEQLTPYSLGKLIDWKRLASESDFDIIDFSPYSLGKLIDWKLRFS